MIVIYKNEECGLASQLLHQPKVSDLHSHTSLSKSSTISPQLWKVLTAANMDEVFYIIIIAMESNMV